MSATAAPAESSAPRAHPELGVRSARSIGAVATLAALALSVLVPDVPLAGPLSWNDVLPLAAVAAGAFVLAAGPWPAGDLLAPLLLALATLGLVVNGLVADGLSFAVLARGPGRALFYAAVILVTRSAAVEVGPRRALAILCAGAAAEAAVGIAAWLTGVEGPYRTLLFRSRNPQSWEHWAHRGRITGTFNYEDGPGMNGLAAYVGLVLPVALALALTSFRRKRLWLGVAAALGFVLVFSHTRAGLLGVVAGLSLSAALGDRPWRRLALPFAAAVVAVTLLLPSARLRFTDSDTDRAALVTAGLTISLERPWLGHGDVPYVPKLFSRADYVSTPFGPATATPHNALVMGLFRYGIAGAALSGLLLLVPVAWFARRARRGEAILRPWALAGVAASTAAAVQAMSNSLLDIPKVTLFLFVVWALLSLAAQRHTTFGSSSS